MTERPLRVLVVCQHFWPEEFRINDICNYLSQNGFDVEVLCGLPNYPSGHFPPGYGLRGPYSERHDGVTIHRVPEIPRRGNSNLRIFLNYLSFPILSTLRIRKLSKRPFDIVFNYQLSPVYMSFSGIAIARLRKIPSITYVLDIWPENLYSVLNIDNTLLRRIAMATSSWIYDSSTHLIALSETMRQALSARTRFTAESISVMPQACEDLYAEDPEESERFPALGDRKIVMFTGNLSPAQSLDTMLEAARILKNKGRDDIGWVIVGDGMSADWLREEIIRLDLSDRVLMTGRVSVAEIPRYTKAADVLVGCLSGATLLEATIPAKVMSYIAAGRPLVLAMGEEVRQLVEERAQCGLVTPPEDANAFAHAIEHVIGLPQEAQEQMASRGRSYHLEHLARDVVYRNLSALLRGAIREK